MRKLLFVICFLLIALPASAQTDILTESRGLADTNGAIWSSKALTAATGTYYSEVIKTSFLAGYSGLLIETTDSITVTFEVSADGTNFYTPYDIDGNALNTIATALTEDRWVVFDLQVALYIRFKVTANANCETSLTLIRR